MQGPAVVASGRWAARQGDQVGLPLVIKLPVSVGLDPILDDSRQPLLSVPPFGAVHRTLGDIQSGRHLWCLPSLSYFE